MSLIDILYIITTIMIFWTLVGVVVFYLFLKSTLRGVVQIPGFKKYCSDHNKLNCLCAKEKKCRS